MIISIIFKIISYWISMGVIIAAIMAGFLYFAIFCEKITDIVFKH